MLSKTTLWIAGLIAVFVSSEVFAARNIVFLNNPSVQDVKDVGSYIVNGTGKPFFSDLVLFAANINGNDPNTPMLYYNTEMSTILKDNIHVVRELQKKGIKVQISYLGNHQYAGWSCDMSAQTATKLANAMVADVVKYGLDGINVDDEYSNCNGNKKAFYSVLKAIKSNPYFSRKVLTKALWSDFQYFSSAQYNVATQLSEGYEMTYGGDVGNLRPYVNYGMNERILFLGISPQYTLASEARPIVKSIVDGGYGGVMIWAPNAFLNTTSASQFYTEIVKAQVGEGEFVKFVP